MKRVESAVCVQPQEATARHMIIEEAVTAEQRLTEPLRTGIHLHTYRTGEIPSSADLPALAGLDLEGDDIAHQDGSQCNSAGTGIRRLVELGARKQLLQAHIDFTLQLHGRRHVDHSSGERLDLVALV